MSNIEAKGKSSTPHGRTSVVDTKRSDGISVQQPGGDFDTNSVDEGGDEDGEGSEFDPHKEDGWESDDIYEVQVH